MQQSDFDSVTENDDMLIKEYLLGELTEDRAADVERRLLTDHAFFERLEMIEGELTDDYVLGALTEREHSGFRNHFLTVPEHRELLAMVEELSGIRAEVPDAQTKTVESGLRAWNLRLFTALFQEPRFAGALAGACLLLASIAVVLLIRLSETRDTLRETQAALDELSQRERELEGEVAQRDTRSAELTQLVERLQHEAADAERRAREPRQFGGTARIIASFVLRPGMVRGSGEPTQLEIPREPGQLVLNMVPEKTGHHSYTAQVETVEGEILSVRSRLVETDSVVGRVVALALPARRLADGIYIVKLFGQDASGSSTRAGTYQFSLSKR